MAFKFKKAIGWDIMSVRTKISFFIFLYVDLIISIYFKQFGNFLWIISCFIFTFIFMIGLHIMVKQDIKNKKRKK